MASQPAPNFEPENIFAAVSQLGIDGKSPHLDGEFWGGECRVFKLSFNDKASVAVRVPHPNNGTSRDNVIATFQIEVNILKELKAKRFHWAPRCLGESLTFENPVKHPFVVLTWAEGLPLKWDENQPLRQHRNNVLGQIASIQVSLIECTRQVGPATATSFFEKRIDNKLGRVRKGNIPGLTEEDCLIQKRLLDQVLAEDRESTVFAMDHGDVSPGNIIVDENYEIKFIIDWGFAALVPMVRAAGFPRFLWPTRAADFVPSRTILEDRHAYTSSLSSHASAAARSMQRWQTADDVDFRTLYLESITSKGMHIDMARMGWKVENVYLGHDEEQSLAGAEGS